MAEGPYGKLIRVMREISRAPGEAMGFGEGWSARRNRWERRSLPS